MKTRFLNSPSNASRFADLEAFSFLQLVECVTSFPSPKALRPGLCAGPQCGKQFVCTVAAFVVATVFAVGAQRCAPLKSTTYALYPGRVAAVPNAMRRYFRRAQRCAPLKSMT